MANRSGGFEFELIGFPGIPPKFDILFCFAMFIVYNITLVSNGSVIVLIITKEKLHEPLYIMIANLAFSNLFYDTVTLPKFIAKYWIDGGKISFLACFIQLYFVHFLSGVDAVILMLMAFDRYVAICKPLRYSSIVTHRVTMVGCGMFWFLIALSTFSNLLILKHPFCGPNKIVSFFCNSSTMLRLACDDVNSTREALMTTAFVLIFLPLTFIVLSYVTIILSIVSLNHSKGLTKALSTCSSHWIAMMLYYVPRVFVYVANYTKLYLSPDLSVFLIFLYSYLPHLANPLIYCLRTEAIKRTITDIFKSKFTT